MREREMLKVTKCVRVNSFVGALINMVCELKILHNLKKIVQKFHGDPTFHKRVINEKQCYAAMKYILACKFICGPIQLEFLSLVDYEYLIVFNECDVY